MATPTAPDTGRLTKAVAPTTAHEVSIIDGRFAIARCTCGWHSSGRRLRATVRTEARDHALLYS
jgi:hypothetical protein